MKSSNVLFKFNWEREGRRRNEVMPSRANWIRRVWHFMLLDKFTCIRYTLLDVHERADHIQLPIDELFPVYLRTGLGQTGLFSNTSGYSKVLSQGLIRSWDSHMEVPWEFYMFQPLSKCACCHVVMVALMTDPLREGSKRREDSWERSLRQLKSPMSETEAREDTSVSVDCWVNQTSQHKETVRTYHLSEHNFNYGNKAEDSTSRIK